MMSEFTGFANIAFKVLASVWGYQSIQYMYATMDYRKHKYNLIKKSLELQPKQLQ